MPVDRPLAEDLAQTLVDLYTDAQTRLAVDVARRLSSGMDLPDWADRKLQGLNTLRRFAGDLLQNLDSAMGDEVAQAMILAYVRGGTAALDDLARAQSRRFDARIAQSTDPSERLLAMIADRATGAAAKLAQARNALPGADAINRLAFSLTSKLQGTHLRILRWDLDAYREVIAKVGTPDVLLGVKTRRRASQVAWERLLSDGITGFTDKSGRNWNLSSYVEMATRTTVAQAAVEGHLDRLSAAGLDLVIVSNAPQECERCRPWEGKVLARGGPGGKRTVQVEHATRDGDMVDVEVHGSVDEAVTVGLMHPNCRHSLSAYLPGVTRVPTNTEDPEGDKARQKLRALERSVRAEKLKAEAAIDPAAGKAAKAKVRDLQGQIRDHVKATGLIRQPSRELVDFGNRPPAGPVTGSPAPKPAPSPPTPKPKPKAPTKATPVQGRAALDAPAARMRTTVTNAAQLAGMSPEMRVLYSQESVDIIWRGGLPDGWSAARARGHARTLSDYTIEQGAAAPAALRAGGAAARRAQQRISDVLATSKTNVDIAVWRGMDQPRLLFGDALNRPMVGTTVRDPSFMSVSTERDIAARYAGDGGLVMRMHVPRGTRAITADNDDDAEIIIDRGYTMRVTADTGPGSMPRVIDVEVVL